MVTVTRARDTDGISRLLRHIEFVQISRELLPFPIPVGILYLCINTVVLHVVQICFKPY